MRLGGKVYVEETGTDATEHTADSAADLTVTVEGEDYEVDATYDVNQDGTDDTAVVVGDDGSSVAFTDVDADGHADVAVEMDEQGNVVGAARYDEATGDWVPVDPNTGQPGGEAGGATPAGNESAPGGGAGAPPAGGEIKVDVPDEAQDYSAGQATVDLNQDGTADTAVVETDDGTKIGFTDTDGDGEADLMTQVDTQGNVTISEHTGEDEWTEVETGHIDAQGNYTSDSGGASNGVQSQPAPQGAATVDPATGQWV